jgi:hypothetical protein
MGRRASFSNTRGALCAETTTWFSKMSTCLVGRIGGIHDERGRGFTPRHASISPAVPVRRRPSAGFTNQSLTGTTPLTGNFLNAFAAILMASRSWSSSSLSTLLVTSAR